MAFSITQPFENDNAKYLNPEVIAKTFVATVPFWQLFSEKNHVIYGTRGSGKTAIARMISHNHLKMLDEHKAKKIIEERQFIGVYAAARLNWVSGIISQKVAQPKNNRDYFVQRFNFVIAQSFLTTLISLMEQFSPLEKAIKESQLVDSILELWTGDRVLTKDVGTLNGLNNLLSKVDFRLQRKHVQSFYTETGSDDPIETDIGNTFRTTPCEPIFILAGCVQECFGLAEGTKFIIAIDEMEFLTTQHHMILNGLMRADTPNFVFKFITNPYCHYTLQTETPAPLIEGNDFEYVHIDHDRSIDTSSKDMGLRSVPRKFHFAAAIFLKRASAIGLEVNGKTLADLLGRSEVLDTRKFPMTETVKVLRQYHRHATEPVQANIRGWIAKFERENNIDKKLEIRTEISDQVLRKMKPFVEIRSTVKRATGATKGTTYSGLPMVLGCTDQNPRFLIKTYKMMFPNLEKQLSKSEIMVPFARQNEVMETMSERFFNSMYALPEYGPDLVKLLTKIGQFFHDRLHLRNIGTDVISSFQVDDTDPEVLELIQKAVAWGYVYPHFKDNHIQALPTREGIFRLSYSCAPKFKILPRRGKFASLGQIFPQRKLL